MSTIRKTASTKPTDKSTSKAKTPQTKIKKPTRTKRAGTKSSSTQQAGQQVQDRSFPSVQLALNGKPIYLREFSATVSVKREEEDMSGQESSTQKSDKGMKAKELTISGVVPYRNPEWLSEIFQLAEATDKKGELVKYRITNFTANSVNMREGYFGGEISASEETVQGWKVSFKLTEQNSVAEKKAKRKKKPKAKVQDEKKAKSKKKKGDKATSSTSGNIRTSSSAPSATSTAASSKAGGNSSTSTQNEPQRSKFDEWLEKNLG